MENKMPVFVKIDEYSDILDMMADIKEKLNNAKVVLNNLEELKEREDSEIDSWRSSVEEIEKKIQFVDHTLFEPDSMYDG